jgi:WD40 repeat protein
MRNTPPPQRLHVGTGIYPKVYAEHYATPAAACRHRHESHRQSSRTTAHRVTLWGLFWSPFTPRGSLHGWVFHDCDPPILFVSSYLLCYLVIMMMITSPFDQLVLWAVALFRGVGRCYYVISLCHVLILLVDICAQDDIIGVDMSTSGNLLATGSDDTTCCVWDIRNWQVILIYPLDIYAGSCIL